MKERGFDGQWAGMNKLWFEDPNVPELSETHLSIDGNRITYTWWFRGSPQKGELVLKPKGHEVTAEWTDTWHSQNIMSCIGTIEPGQVSIVGHYNAGDQVWGWRTHLIRDTKDHLLIRMYNIDPEEEETIAVEFDLRPA